jgi:hypothetical protein
MDRRLYNFLKDVDGNVEKLPLELRHAITRKGGTVLTVNALMHWFKYDLDLTNIDEKKQFAFELINKHFFGNKSINSLEELKMLTEKNHLEVIWAVGTFLLKNDLPLDTYLAVKNVDELIKLVTDLQNNEDYMSAIAKELERFDRVVSVTSENGSSLQPAVITDDMKKQARAYVMMYFDGTLAGAIKAAHTFRGHVRSVEMARNSQTESGSQTYGGKKGDKEITEEDTWTEEDEGQLVTGTNLVFNSILALYEKEGLPVEIDMIGRLTKAFYENGLTKIIEKRTQSEDARVSLRKMVIENTLQAHINKLRDKIHELESQMKVKFAEEERKTLNVLLSIEAASTKLKVQTAEYAKKLNDLSEEEIARRYESLLERELADNPSEAAFTKPAGEKKKEGLSTDRTAIQGRMKKLFNKIIPLLNSGEISINNLLPEVRNFFVSETVTDADGKSTVIYKMNTDVYSVGKGAAATTIDQELLRRLKIKDQKAVDALNRGEISYDEVDRDIQLRILKVETPVGKKTVTIYKLDPDLYKAGAKGGDALYSTKLHLDKQVNRKHSTDRIFANERLLKKAWTIIEADRKMKAQLAKEADEYVRALERAKKKADEQHQKEIDKLKKKYEAEKQEVHQTEFMPKRKKNQATTDTPSQFTVISPIEMPEVLKDILDVSFTEMADTEVQYISKDKEGNLYDKETFKDKKFDGEEKHELINAELFFEAVGDKLMKLTRQDVLDIIEFFERGATVFDTAMSRKFGAFRIFITGFFVETLNYNPSEWNLSAAERAYIDKLYERFASEAGTNLNAVKQMINRINPYNRIRQKFMEDFGVEAGDVNNLIDAFEAFQKADNATDRKARAVDLDKMIKSIEKKMITPKEKKWSKRWYKYFKNYRYMSMLSSPATWARNSVSNLVVTSLNSTSTFIADNILFRKKDYKEGQWAIGKVKVSEDVRSFMKSEIIGNPLLDWLYGTTSKYDTTDKSLTRRQEIFANKLTAALEAKYRAEHNFGDAKLPNTVSKWISRMINDKAFIKKATEKYLGKILTIEAENGNISLEDGLTENVLNLFAEALYIANHDYMHKQSALGDMLDSLKKEHPGWYETITLVQPFLNSGWNWFTAGLRYTPLGLIDSISRLIKLDKTVKKIEEARARGADIPSSRLGEYFARRDIGRGIIGTISITFAFFCVFGGLIKIEDDEDENKIYLAAGNHRIDVSDVFGTSSFLIGASIAQGVLRHQEKDEDYNVMDTVEQCLDYMLNGFVVTDLLQRHEWDDSITEHLITETESVFKSIVPQFVQLFVRASNNENIRYSSGFKGGFQRWMNSFVVTQPFGSRKVNPYTGAVESKYALSFWGELAKSGLLGARIFYSEINENERMCREFGVNKRELEPEITLKYKDGNETKKKKVNLGDKEGLNTKYGQLNAISLEKIKSQSHYVEMPNGKFKTLPWDKLSDEQKSKVINRTMTENAETAKIWYWTSVLKHKYYASDSEWQSLRKLGITQNVYRGDKGFAE